LYEHQIFLPKTFPITISYAQNQNPKITPFQFQKPQFQTPASISDQQKKSKQEKISPKNLPTTHRLRQAAIKKKKKNPEPRSHISHPNTATNNHMDFPSFFLSNQTMKTKHVKDGEYSNHQDHKS